jgi:hypothetical protein
MSLSGPGLVSQTNREGDTGADRGRKIHGKPVDRLDQFESRIEMNPDIRCNSRRYPMRSFSSFALALAVGIGLTGKADEKDAKALAQQILDKGAALFDTRDATAMAATYTEDAQIDWIEKDQSTGEIQFKVKKGRSEIESLYRDLFKDAKEQTTSKNTVEFARLVSPEILMIEGTFQPDTAKDLKVPFVQMRIKLNDKWVMRSLQIFVLPKE